MCVSFILGDNMEKYMLEALKEAQKSLKYDDVPVGAVIVENDKIISRGYNKKEKKKSAILHAEIIAINKACKKKKDWHLDNCTLYVTMEPCLMCCGAIIQSRIKKVVYGCKNEKFGHIESIDKVLNNPKSNHFVEIEKGLLEDKCRVIVQKFFKAKRK